MRSSRKAGSASSAFVNVVLPEEVPPAIRMFARFAIDVPERRAEGRGERALIDIVAEFERGCCRLADGKAGRGRDRRQKPFKPLAAAGEFGRDNRGGAVCGFSHTGGDKPDDPFAVRGVERVLGDDERRYRLSRSRPSRPDWP